MLSIFLLLLRSASSITLNFCQTTALTGSASSVGVPVRQGLLAGFQKFNQENPWNATIVLYSMDDTYDPTMAGSNTVSLMNTYGCIGFVGGYGTATGISVKQAVAPFGNIPIIGQVSGGVELRGSGSSLVRNFVNTRASLYDEAAAMINFIYNFYGGNMTRISAFYQNDAFGLGGLTGLQYALEERMTRLDTWGSYPRKTVNVMAGLDAIMLGNPQIICMFSVGEPSAVFIKQAKLRNPNLIFVATTFVGSLYLGANLTGELGPFGVENVYVLQSFPMFNNLNDPFIKEYQQSLSNFNSSIVPDFNQLDGYITARLTTSVLTNLFENNLAINGTSFLQTVYQTSVFNLLDFRVGPYGDYNCPFCQCNQGLHGLWVNGMDSNGYYKTINTTEFYFASCGYNFQLPTILSFAMMTPLSGPFQNLSVNFARGIDLAFYRVNRNGGVLGKTLQVQTIDDQLNETIALSILNNLPSSYLGLLMPQWPDTFQNAFSTAIQTGLPIIQPINEYGIHSQNDTVINIQASMDNDVQALISSALTRVSSFYYFVMNSDAGNEYVQFAASFLSTLGMSLKSGLNVTSIDITTDVNTAGVILSSYLSIVEATIPPSSKAGIIVHGSANFVAAVVKVFGPIYSNCNFLIPSLVDNSVLLDNSLLLLDHSLQSNVWIANIFPHYKSNFSTVATTFRYFDSELYSPVIANQAVFEAYIVGTFVAEALRRSVGSITPDSFIKSIYDAVYIGVADLRLGPFYSPRSIWQSASVCNQGAGTVYVTSLSMATSGFASSSSSYSSTYSSCGRNSLYQIYYLPTAVVTILNLCAAIAIVGGVVGLVYIVLYRHEQIVKASDPTLTSITITGCIIYFVQIPFLSIQKVIPTCVASIWIQYLGFAFVFGSMLVKAYRISAIFGTKEAKKMASTAFVKNPVNLLIMIVVIILLFVIFLTVWTLVEPPSVQTINVDSFSYSYCSQKDPFWTYIGFIVQFVVLVIGVVLSLQSRKAWQEFNESKSVAITIYDQFFITVIILLTQSSTNSPVVNYVVASVCYLFHGCLVLALNVYFKFGWNGIRRLTVNSDRGGSKSGVKSTKSNANIPGRPKSVAEVKSEVKSFNKSQIEPKGANKSITVE